VVTWRRIGEDSLSILAAGIAFQTFSSLFPTLKAAVSLYGLVADPGMGVHVLQPSRFGARRGLGALRRRRVSVGGATARRPVKPAWSQKFLINPTSGGHFQTDLCDR
jgi:hypothetical protein